MLTDRQIERYSRQIVVPEFGARGQERLLASRLQIIASPDCFALPAAYLASAGFGAISIAIPAAPAKLDFLTALNSDCAVTAGVDNDADLALCLTGDADTIEAVKQRLADWPWPRTIIARLDEPARIAILPSFQAASLRSILDQAFSLPTKTAPIVAMAAAAEAIRIGAGYAPVASQPVLITFDGYTSFCSALADRASHSP
jgi:hypothetical protein